MPSLRVSPVIIEKIRDAKKQVVKTSFKGVSKPSPAKKLEVNLAKPEPPVTFQMPERSKTLPHK